MNTLETLKAMDAKKCCCGCGNIADGPSFSTPYDATNKYRGGKTTAWAAACWEKNVELSERIRNESLAFAKAAIAAEEAKA